MKIFLLFALIPTLAFASGCVLTPEQVHDMQGVAAAINEGVAENEHRHDMQERSQPQYVRQPLMPVLPQTVQVTPVDQWGFPIH